MKLEKANNNSFSKISYIHGIIKSQKVSYDLCFAFLDMFWPGFIIRNDMVFIKDSFDEKQDLLKNTYKDDKEKEYWINLLSIDGLFSEKIDEDKLDFLAKKMAESWKEKLVQDFPERRFKYVGNLWLTTAFCLKKQSSRSCSARAGLSRLEEYR